MGKVETVVVIIVCFYRGKSFVPFNCSYRGTSTVVVVVVRSYRGKGFVLFNCSYRGTSTVVVVVIRFYRGKELCPIQLLLPRYEYCVVVVICLS